MSKELRSKIIRLAHSKPELRKHLLPLVKTSAQKLTKDQIEEIKGEMVSKGVPVRFMKGGGSMNIVTGEIEKGANVMHQIVYWNFTKETSKKIAKMLGARAVFS